MLKLILFSVVLMWASVIDIKSRIVPNKILVALFIIGLLNISISSIIGLLITFIPFFIVAMFSNVGGGDVKLAAMCGFVLQSSNGLVALFLGISIAALIAPIVNKIYNKPCNAAFPLVPYLAVGCIITNIIIIK